MVELYFHTNQEIDTSFHKQNQEIDIIKNMTNVILKRTNVVIKLCFES